MATPSTATQVAGKASPTKEGGKKSKAEKKKEKT